MTLLLPHDTALIQLTTSGASIDTPVHLDGPFLRMMSDMQTALEVHAEELGRVITE